MISHSGRAVLAALIIIAADHWRSPATARLAFRRPGFYCRLRRNRPGSPSKTAALVPPDRAAPERQRPVQKVQQTYQPAPAEGAGRSRSVPPSEAPVHSPIVVPPKNKQFKAPVARVDPSYVERIAARQ